jgi:uncharacterized membrane protein
MSNDIYKWLSDGLIKPADQHRALVLAGERPDTNGWYQFLLRLMILMGMLSLAVGVVFFFAYNWNDMGHMVKFGLLQLVLLVAFVTFIIREYSPWVSQVLLLTGVIVLGALLALFGQTYQTGADPWQMFATWALMVVPVVLFGRSEALWLFWVVLLNTALALCFHVHRSLFGLLFSSEHQIWAYLLLNGLAFVLIDWLSHAGRDRWRLGLRHTWSAQVMGLLMTYLIVLVGLQGIWGRGIAHAMFTVIFLLLMSAAFWLFRYVRQDLLLLTGWASGVTIYMLSVLGNSIMDDLDASGLLVLAMLLIAMTTATVSWIRKLKSQFSQEGGDE